MKQPLFREFFYSRHRLSRQNALSRIMSYYRANNCARNAYHLATNAEPSPSFSIPRFDIQKEYLNPVPHKFSLADTDCRGSFTSFTNISAGMIIELHYSLHSTVIAIHYGSIHSRAGNPLESELFVPCSGTRGLHLYYRQCLRLLRCPPSLLTG